MELLYFHITHKDVKIFTLKDLKHCGKFYDYKYQLLDCQDGAKMSEVVILGWKGIDNYDED